MKKGAVKIVSKKQAAPKGAACKIFLGKTLESLKDSRVWSC